MGNDDCIYITNLQHRHFVNVHFHNCVHPLKLGESRVIVSAKETFLLRFQQWILFSNALNCYPSVQINLLVSWSLLINSVHLYKISELITLKLKLLTKTNVKLMKNWVLYLFIFCKRKDETSVGFIFMWLSYDRCSNIFRTKSFISIFYTFFYMRL